VIRAKIPKILVLVQKNENSLKGLTFKIEFDIPKYFCKTLIN